MKLSIKTIALTLPLSFGVSKGANHDTDFIGAYGLDAIDWVGSQIEDQLYTLALLSSDMAIAYYWSAVDGHLFRRDSYQPIVFGHDIIRGVMMEPEEDFWMDWLEFVADWDLPEEDRNSASFAYLYNDRDTAQFEEYSFALVKLEKPLENVEPVQMRETPLQFGEILNVIGFSTTFHGLTNMSNVTAQKKQFPVVVLPPESCFQCFHDDAVIRDETIFCAEPMDPNDIVDEHAIILDSSGRLVGLTPYGFYDECRRSPAIFLISTIGRHDWISKNICKFSDDVELLETCDDKLNEATVRVQMKIGRSCHTYMDYWSWGINSANGTNDVCDEDWRSEIRCDGSLIVYDHNFTEELSLLPGNYLLSVGTDAYGGGFQGRERVEITAIVDGTTVMLLEIQNLTEFLHYPYEYETHYATGSACFNFTVPLSLDEVNVVTEGCKKDWWDGDWECPWPRPTIEAPLISTEAPTSVLDESEVCVNGNSLFWDNPHFAKFDKCARANDCTNAGECCLADYCLCGRPHGDQKCVPSPEPPKTMTDQPTAAPTATPSVAETESRDDKSRSSKGMRPRGSS